MSGEGGDGAGDELHVSTGIVRNADGSFGVWSRVHLEGRPDVGAIEENLVDDTGALVRFTTERDAKIAAFDWAADIRRRAMKSPPPGSAVISEGPIEQVE